ncbi:hypothetical protein ETH_00022095 [Eimeria tenella]|uniref:Uncharacterized protein n=1 Tax=Eimeria tenella TaxID=5802 RepID=U6LCJ1_EIMTE|nr:hypothetical protein ETH_00022095 [Eimeria tenella]CDJ45455.1 hypothetical protein ETH_00022095 [Eimeria tenella]|eukprot:XP_013236201.1 hypothetical protein ETH_00022095 [Eimeria tenella]
MADVADARRAPSWLPLSFSIRGGGLFTKLAMQLPAQSDWQAVRNAKELLR